MSAAQTQSRSPLRRVVGAISLIFAFIYKAFFVLSIVLGLVLAWVIWSGATPARVGERVALVLAPSGTLVEQAIVDPGQRLLEQWAGEEPAQTSIGELREALERAAHDDRVKLVVLKLDGLMRAGFGPMQELADALRAFRSSGKPVEVWATGYDQAQYLVAAQADGVSLDPYGAVWIEGLSSYGSYFAEALDKLGADVTVFRVGEFKSAVEPFIRNDMSPEAREADAEWLGDLWREYQRMVAKGRRASGAEALDLDAYVEGLAQRLDAAGGDLAGLQQQLGLVDHLESLEAYRQRIAEQVGIDQSHGSFNQIHHRDYLRAVQREAPRKAPSKPLVAQITVQGAIVDGSGDMNSAGGDSIAELLHQARRDDRVAAVLLRIDSPGGSVMASERIRRAVRAVQAAGKPVVASMSSLAASGGYWVAMDADEIWAYEHSITGSIGVFGLWLSVDEGLGKLGIRTDGVGTTSLAGALRPDRPLSPQAARIFQSSVEHSYAQFIDGVAQGRDLPRAAVEQAAEGRVWSGRKAHQLALVDRIGGLQAAAARAAEHAGLDVDGYWLDAWQPAVPSPFPGFGRLFGSIEQRLAALAGRWLGLQGALPVDALSELPRWLTDRSGRYAFCACDVNIGGERLNARH